VTHNGPPKRAACRHEKSVERRLRLPDAILDRRPVEQPQVVLPGRQRVALTHHLGHLARLVWREDA
jgi:hypothetical protein